MSCLFYCIKLFIWASQLLFPLPQDKVGPFCRTAIDCGVITETMLGKDPDDPGSVKATLLNPVDVNISSLRIGFARNADVKVSLHLFCPLTSKSCCIFAAFLDLGKVCILWITRVGAH